VAILAQKRLNNKVRRLEAMLEIRRLVVDGHSYDDIQQVLGLSKRTFYRYLNRVFEEDKRVLEKENYKEVMIQVVILRDPKVSFSINGNNLFIGTARIIDQGNEC
jgi:DNA invertase Pin-like site-specific DNA recombinase